MSISQFKVKGDGFLIVLLFACLFLEKKLRVFSCGRHAAANDYGSSPVSNRHDCFPGSPDGLSGHRAFNSMVL
jgi:hypothetical protein